MVPEKTKNMKQFIALALAAVSFAACSDNEGNTTKSDNMDTTSILATPPVDATTTTYVAVDGDVTYRDNKLLVMKNGAWVEADKDVTLDNGVVVYRSGQVKHDKKEIQLQDGEIVNKSGDFFDRTGRAIENAWDDTKEGVKDAGKDVKKAAKKAEDKVEGAVDDDHKE